MIYASFTLHQIHALWHEHEVMLAERDLAALEVAANAQAPGSPSYRQLTARLNGIAQPALAAAAHQAHARSIFAALRSRAKPAGSPANKAPRP